MTMKNKAACCYLTHEHPEVMDEVLGNICKLYGEKGIDVYVYDSSTGDDTRRVVDKYREMGLCNLTYVPMQFAKGKDGGNEKYLYVLKGYGLEGHYDYIWPTKDRCWFEGKTLDDICDAIDENHDIVFAVDERDRFEIISKPIKGLYTDAVDFFEDYGALTTNWECLIRRTDTMIEPIDWIWYEKEYSVGVNNNFNQTITTFVRLSEMSECDIRVISSEIDDKRYSDRAKPLWTESVFEVWIDRWIPAIFSLPSIYDGYKLRVIKTQLGHVSLFGSNDSLVAMRDMGLFTKERYGQLSSMWEMISRIPRSNLDRIINNDEYNLFEENYDAFLVSFKDREYDKGYYLFIQNSNFIDKLGKEQYRILALSYYLYLRDARRGGYSLLFDGVDSLEGLVGNFEKYSKN